MNIFESLANVLMHEHGRPTFVGQYGYSINAPVFWRIALIAYGVELFDMPKRLGLVLEGDKKEFSFPAFTIKSTLTLGIPPSEALLYRTMGGYDHQYTPIHLATGILKYLNPEHREEALRLLDLKLMKKLWGEAGRKKDDFASQAVANPYCPEDFKLQPYSIDMLKFNDLNAYFDELGNMFWFPEEYIRDVLHVVRSELWYHNIHSLTLWRKKWEPLRTYAAARRLNQQPLGKSDSYMKIAKLIRFVKPEVARSWVKDQAGGVGVVASCFRSDASPEEMHVGLRALANAKSSVLDTSYHYIGRALQVEDVQKLNGSQLLTILNNSHDDVVRPMIDRERERLCAILFSLPADKYKDALSCLEKKERKGTWYPDTPEGNHRLHTQSEKTIETLWKENMHPLMLAYAEMKNWREDLFRIADPDVAFLGMLRWSSCVGGAAIPVPAIAIENVLRSFPQTTALQEHIARCPLAKSAFPSL